MKRLSWFTGIHALIAKIIVMALLDALMVSMFFTAYHKKSTPIELAIGIIFLLLNYVYFSKRTMPMKFLTPGIILMVLFILVPVVYTVAMSFFNFQTGNLGTKQGAITSILQDGLTPDSNNTQYDMTIGSLDGKTTVLLTNPATKISYVGNAQTSTVLAPGTFTVAKNGDAVGYPQFTPYTADQFANLGDQISALKVPIPGENGFAEPQTENSAALFTEEYSYDSQKDQLTNTQTGQVYTNNGNGNFALSTDKAKLLYPGWKSYNGFSNYLHLFDDAAVRGPFIGVFIWTICFSFITVLMMFAVGLMLAIILDRKIGLKRFYRSILILPYAIPSLMSILVWKGMFQTQFGAINGLFGTHIDFLDSTWMARGVVLIVNLWLGFPYFYLISSGALQSVPAELSEAASIDGASPFQILRQIKLPLVLQILSPLLIASFAFNFNNFNLIYLLTGGGPANVLAGKTAGATDILITYTYKTAFNGTTSNFGLASAISMVIFFIIGGLSLWSIRRANVLDNNS